MVDFSKYQVKKSEGIKIPPEDKTTHEDSDQKVAHARHEKVPKPVLEPIKPKRQKNPSIDVNLIDSKINEVVNDRILKLVKLGLKHELTIENMIQHFKETGKLKQYDLTRFFSDASPGKIDQMLQFLYTTKVLRKDRNGWYQLKNAPAHNFSNVSE